jgi:peptidoglycan/LPS O-acetylase OafA/YrhL
LFDGVRALTLMWVMMGNTFMNSLIGAVNIITLDFVFQRPFILIIECALLTVDIFFFLGGFFIAYKFAKEIGKIGRYPWLVLKRALRFLPAYLLVILVWYSMFIHLGSGPKWIPNEEYPALCKNMWRTVLFIDNLVNNGHTLCMSWAFYMQIEFQVFLCSLAILLFYSRSKLGSFCFAAALVAFSWTVNLVYTEQHHQEYPITFKALANYQDYIFDIFIKPHTRWTPYFFGIFIGLAYAEYVSADHQKESISSFRKASLAGKVLLMRLAL